MAIVVSHVASDFDRLAHQALRQAPLSDLIELRLDRIGNPGEDVLREFVAAAPKAVIVSVHGPEAHGEFTGGDDERLDLLETAARAGASFVDVDWRLSLALGEVAGKCHRIVSRHETDGTPEDLHALQEEVRAVLYEGDLIKLVTHADSTEDGLRMLQLVGEVGGGLIGFCSGEVGRFTRVLAPIFGSPFTYAAPADLPDTPAPERTAPGQIRVNDLRGIYPPGGVSMETAIFGVVGRDARYSWSPHVHGMALKAARLDAVYVSLEPESVGALLELARWDNWRGFSVTAPFKEEAARLAYQSDAATKSTAACNTLVRDPQGWQARNTDATAVARTLEAACKLHARRSKRAVVPEALSVLVLGTGGAARACVHAVGAVGARPIVAGRHAERARALAQRFEAQAIEWDAIEGCAYDVLIHATPVGSIAHAEAGAEGDARMPVPAAWLRPEAIVIDAVYRPVRTPLLTAAVARGCTAVPGGEWFVRQAAEQFAVFTQQPADDAILRAAFDNAIGVDRGLE